jgi:hypothetical protein
VLGRRIHSLLEEHVATSSRKAKVVTVASKYSAYRTMFDILMNQRRDCALDDSCVLCARCFHATDHTGHNVSFFIAQQSGGCCDCGDDEAWRKDIRCPHHPPAGPDDPQDTTSRLILKPISNETTPCSALRFPCGHSIRPQGFHATNNRIRT